MDPAQIKKLDVVPFMTQPVGWMPCVACRDFRKKPGQMWVGYSAYAREDLFITCPVCKGTGQVTRLKHIDIRTGNEIDYERPGQKFIHAETLPPGQILFTDPSADGGIE